MKLPNGGRGVVDIAKLCDYCLSLDHRCGRHKARVFAAALGLTADRAEELRAALPQAVRTEECHGSRRIWTAIHRRPYNERARRKSSSSELLDRPESEGFPPPDQLLCTSEKKETVMSNAIKLLDVVALTEDLLERCLSRGQVGTVVENLGPDIFEVEFCDDEGRTYASLALRADQIMVLHYRPLQVA